MQFPTRSGAAQGGLVKGNLFAQSGAPAFSHTKNGEDTIHITNGRISVVRANAQDNNPCLLLPYYGNGMPRNFQFSPDPGAIEKDTALNPQASLSTGRGVFVGDGYFLCATVADTDTKSLGFFLVSIDDPGAPVIGANYSGLPSGAMGDNIRLQTDAILSAITPWGDVGASCIATGWRDEQRRYGFAIFGVSNEGRSSFYASRYVCIVGDTGTRTTKTFVLPNRPDSSIPLLRAPPRSGAFGGPPIPASLEYKTGWWGAEAVHPASSPTLFEKYDLPEAARCYCVGRGHLLAMLVPQERICSYTERFGLGPEHAETIGIVTPSWLPPGSAPYLLRSRDFGETWTMEKADFLVAEEPPSSDNVVLKVLRDGAILPDGPTPSPYIMEDAVFPEALQRVPPCGHFIAAPFGGGRIAIAALGPYSGSIHEDEMAASEDAPWRSISGRAWRFFVSGTDGTGFVRKPFPMDSMRASEPRIAGGFGGITYGPAEREFEIPLFNEHMPAPRAFSFAPGHFVFSSVKFRVTGAGEGSTKFNWGKYPDDYHVTTWTTYDYGDTWESRPFPAELLFGAEKIGDTTGADIYYSIYPNGPLSRSDAHLLKNQFRIGPLGSVDGGRPIYTYARFGIATNQIHLYASTDPDDPIGSLSLIANAGTDTIKADITNLSALSWMGSDNFHEAFYTGHFASLRRRELVYPGYPEFEGL